MQESFRKISQKIAELVGSPAAFLAVLGIVFVWAVTGPAFNYSDNWKLFIGTGTSVVTFLMVFLIQNSQNRESKILHLKIDELIRSSARASNSLLNLDNHSDVELVDLHNEICSLKKEVDSRQKIDRAV